VLDEKGNFKRDNFAKLRSEVAPPEEASGVDNAPSTSGRGQENGARPSRGRGRGYKPLLGSVNAGKWLGSQCSCCANGSFTAFF